MLENLAGVDVLLTLLLEGSYFWCEEDKLLQSVQEVQQQNTHIYPFTIDDKLLQISIQGTQ